MASKKKSATEEPEDRIAEPSDLAEKSVKNFAVSAKKANATRLLSEAAPSSGRLVDGLTVIVGGQHCACRAGTPKAEFSAAVLAELARHGAEFA